MRKTLLLICTSILYTFGETHLSGDISGKTFDMNGNPYIVEQDITVPEGKKLILKEGCVFLFKPFTGLAVYGSISVEGSKTRPVVFSSINDNEYNAKSQQLPNPFDWNGVLIAKETMNASFKNFYLRYSVYGLKSQFSRITVQDGTFRQNGQFHFTINDKIEFVQDNVPYSYTSVSQAPTTEQSKPPLVIETQEKKNTSRTIFRYTSLSVGVLGLGACAILTPLTLSAYNEERDIFQDPNKLEAYAERDAALKKRKNLQMGAIVSGVLGLIGAGGFVATFYF